MPFDCVSRFHFQIQTHSDHRGSERKDWVDTVNTSQFHSIRSFCSLEAALRKVDWQAFECFRVKHTSEFTKINEEEMKSDGNDNYENWPFGWWLENIEVDIEVGLKVDKNQVDDNPVEIKILRIWTRLKQDDWRWFEMSGDEECGQMETDGLVSDDSKEDSRCSMGSEDDSTEVVWKEIGKMLQKMVGTGMDSEVV